MAANWRSASWEVDLSEVEKLSNLMSKIPAKSEEILNKTLQNNVEKTADSEIIKGMPRSVLMDRLKGKTHAKDSKSLNVKHENLGFTIRPVKKFNYLKFPDLAIGTSWKNTPQEFMRKGMEKKVPEISKILEGSLVQEIEKILGGK